MTVSLIGLHPTLMLLRVKAAIEDPRAVKLGLYVMSAYRSILRQQQLWDAALDKYGDPEIADNWVARPGTSNHGPKVDGFGTAVDFALPGVHADADGHWPPDVRRQVDAICADHGLASPMDWEDWHYEPIAGWIPPVPNPHTPSRILVLEGAFMGLFANDDDAAAWTVRDAFLTHLLREPESEDEAKAWVGWLRTYGMDSMTYSIVDSPEGQAVLAAKRKALGL